MNGLEPPEKSGPLADRLATVSDRSVLDRYFRWAVAVAIGLTFGYSTAIYLDQTQFGGTNFSFQIRGLVLVVYGVSLGLLRRAMRGRVLSCDRVAFGLLLTSVAFFLGAFSWDESQRRFGVVAGLIAICDCFAALCLVGQAFVLTLGVGLRSEAVMPAGAPAKAWAVKRMKIVFTLCLLGSIATTLGYLAHSPNSVERRQAVQMIASYGTLALLSYLVISADTPLRRGIVGSVSAVAVFFGVLGVFSVVEQLEMPDPWNRWRVLFEVAQPFLLLATALGTVSLAFRKKENAVPNPT